MLKSRCLVLGILFLFSSSIIRAGDGLVPRFPLEACDIQLDRLAQPNTPFDKVGRKFAIFGVESGSFEAWSYPLKLFRKFDFSFLLGTSTQPIEAKDIARFISVTPAATTLTYAYQSFTVKAIYITGIEEPGAVILLEVDTTEPLTIICSFIPVLQPMWPAGIGGQYAYWDDNAKAYLISEPTRKNHTFVGSPAGEGISYTPAHMLSDVPNQFKIAVEKPETVRGKYIPIVMAGGKGKREDIRKVYERLAADPENLYRAAAEHYSNLRHKTLQVKTPNKKLDLAFEWAKVAYDNLIVDNPDLGKGLVAGLGPSGTGGRPGFGWFFGGDAYMNSLSLNSYGAYDDVRTALAFTQKWQRADGKMAHELSQAAGYVDWFKDYPYGYIHADTTPFYIAASYDYFQKTGDGDFIKKSWASLKRAYDWCLSTDENGDGLMDNKKAGLGALEFGALTGIMTDIYLASVWIRATYALEQLAKAGGDGVYAKRAGQDHARALQALEEKLWDSEAKQYSYAFNQDGKRVPELTPWPALGLIWGQGDTERRVQSLERMCAADLTTDWGIRILSDKSALFEPLNYNYGAVWPFLSGWVATAQFKHNLVHQGYATLMSIARHSFDNSLGSITELFSGSQNIWPQEAVPHQGFSSSGVVLPLVRGLLGLEGDALEKKIIFEPRFPADWEKAEIGNFVAGGKKFSISCSREKNKITALIRSPEGSGYKMSFSPALGLGTKILGVFVDGKPISFKEEQSRQSRAVQPIVEWPLSGSDKVEILFEPVFEILPFEGESRTGDPDRGLKIIQMSLAQNELRVIVEGLAKRTYQLRTLNSDLADSVSGARLEADILHIQIPDGPDGEFLRHEILARLKTPL
jgi:glycogen debranching enzyme